MTNAQSLSSVTLTKGWQFKQTNDTGEDAWMTVERVPTNVHLDLIEHGKYVLAKGTNSTTAAEHS
jgi:beta-mannosidase